MTLMAPRTCKKLHPRRSCAATSLEWDGKGLDVAAGGVQDAGAAPAALQDAQWPCPQHKFLLMPRQAELNKENPTKVSGVLQLGSPACACGGAGQALEQGRCRNALLGGEKSRWDCIGVDLIGLNSMTRWSREVIKLETSNYI